MDVQGPDGQTYSFPDGMGEDEVLGVMRQKFGLPTDPQNLGRAPEQQTAPAPQAPAMAGPSQDTSAFRYPRLALQAINSGLAGCAQRRDHRYESL